MIVTTDLTNEAKLETASCSSKTELDAQAWSARLDRVDTLAIKALACLAIVSHNFLHQVPPSPEENEFSFHSAEGIWTALATTFAHPAECLHAWIAFLGHYGVVLFVLMSGYGLTAKYAERSWVFSWRSAYGLVGEQLRKLIGLMAVGGAAGLVYQCIVLGKDWISTTQSFLLCFTFTNNVREGGFEDFEAVWWFVGLIAQLYLLFPTLCKGIEERPALTWGLAFAGLCVAGVFYNESPNVYLFATPLSFAVIFLTGISLARGMKIKIAVVKLFAVLFLFSQFVEVLFPISFLSFGVLALYVYNRYFKCLRKCKSILWFGRLSMFVFIVHGYLRMPAVQLLRDIQKTAFQTTGEFLSLVTLLVFFAWLLLVVGLALAVQSAYRFLFNSQGSQRAY